MSGLMLACMLSIAGVGPVTGVAPVHGVPTFTVDGQPYLTPSFETYVPQAKYFASFANAGVRVFMFNANAGACDYGHSLPIRPAEGTWDFSQFDAQVLEVLSVCPEGWLLPRVYLGTPAWWLAAHPEALEVLDDGSTTYREPNRNPTQPKGRAFPSLASEAWRSFVAEGLRQLLAHVAAAPYAERIFGYELTGLDTEEWYHWSAGSDQLAGYSPPTVEAFRAWLRGKYGDDAALEAAWRRPGIRLATAQVPPREARVNTPGALREPDSQQDVIDFYRFYNELVPDTIDHFAKVVKDATGRTKVVGAFYGYMYEFQGDPEYGHNALARFASRPNIDFMAVTASYFNRAPGSGGDYLRSPLLSLWRGGKVWYHDNDTVSVLGRKMHGLDAPGGNPSMAGQLSLLGMADTMEGSRWMYRRGAGFALCHGLFNAFFDLHGGYFDAPELMAEVAQLGAVSTGAAAANRGSVAEVLVVSDEDSCEYYPFRSPALAECLLPVQHRLLSLGAPVDHVLLSDLGAIETQRYKLVIFLNAVNIDPDEAQAIQRVTSRENPPMIVWCHAPGYVSGGATGTKAMRAISGIEIGQEGAVPPTRRVVFEANAALGEVWDAALPAEIETQCGQFSVAEGNVAVLARYGDGGVALAMRGQPGRDCAVYSATPNLPTVVYRALAHAAGVHLYTERLDTFYCNASFLTLHANGAGQRALNFPRAVTLRDAVTKQMLATGVTRHQFTLADGETALIEFVEAP